MIDLSPDQLEDVRRILREHCPGVEARVFGSRAAGSAGRFSDLDLALVGDRRFDRRRLESLRDAFSESDLPFTVDVLDWASLPESFRVNILMTGFEILQLD